MLLFCSTVVTSAPASTCGREVIRCSLQVATTQPAASVIDSMLEWRQVFLTANVVSRRRRQCNPSSSLFWFFGYLRFSFQNAGFYHGRWVSCTPIHFKHYSSQTTFDLIFFFFFFPPPLSHFCVVHVSLVRHKESSLANSQVWHSKSNLEPQVDHIPRQVCLFLFFILFFFFLSSVVPNFLTESLTKINATRLTDRRLRFFGAAPIALNWWMHSVTGVDWTNQKNVH